MANIEKEFYSLLEKDFPECTDIAFHLAERGALLVSDMERYIIVRAFNKLKEKKIKTMEAYRILSEKYYKSDSSIRKICTTYAKLKL